MMLSFSWKISRQNCLVKLASFGEKVLRFKRDCLSVGIITFLAVGFFLKVFRNGVQLMYFYIIYIMIVK